MSKIIGNDVTWKDITPGGLICDAGNAAEFRTGDWRSIKPVWDSEKCKNCLLCFPVCPDSSILISEDGTMAGIDYDHCKGCGVCAQNCPFNALSMTDE